MEIKGKFICAFRIPKKGDRDAMTLARVLMDKEASDSSTSGEIVECWMDGSAFDRIKSKVLKFGDPVDLTIEIRGQNKVAFRIKV